LLHREKDVGRPKAIAAAEFVMKRVPGVTVTPYVLTKFSIGLTNALLRYHGKIQDKDEEYYKQFQIIICGLDSIEARRWINATLVGMVDEDDPDSLKPLIDGGTEGGLPTSL
jgi:NEDD8-activating enzyme E1